MSNPNTPSSEQQAVENPPVVEASAQQVSSDHNATIDGLAGDQLMQLLEGETLEIPTPTASEEVIPEGQQEVETPAASVQQVVEETATATPGEGKTKTRLSVKALPPEQQQEMAEAIDLVRDQKAPDILAALQMLRGTATTVAAQETTTPVETAAAPVATPEVSAIQATIDDLSAQRDQADDDFDKPRVRELDAQIRAQERLLIKAELVAEQQQQAAVSYEAQYEAAVETLESRFPDVLDESTEFFQLLDDKVTAARARKDPALADPNYILKFAEALDATLNPKAKTAAPIPGKPVTRSTMGTAVAPAHSSAPRLTQADTDALIKNASPDDLLAIIGTH